MKWVKLAAGLGSPNAQWTLHNIYVESHDLAVREEGRRWLRLAVDQGFEPAIEYVNKYGWRDRKPISEVMKELPSKTGELFLGN